MSPQVAILVTVLVPSLLGFGIVRAMSRGARQIPLGSIGWAYPLGAMGTALILGAWMLSGIGPIRWLAIALPALAGIALLLFVRQRPPPVAAPPLRRVERLESGVFWLLLAIVVLILLDRIAVFDLFPVIVGDEAWIWSVRAKFLYADWISDVSVSPATEAQRVVGQPHYPLLNPLMHVWSFVVSGGITQVANRVPFHAVLLSLVIGTAVSLRAILRPATAALFLLLWIPSPTTEPIFLHAMADVLAAAGFVLALEAWRAFDDDGAKGSWRLFSCALALLVASKQEGTMLLVAILVGCAFHAWRDPGVRARVRALGATVAWLALPVAILAATWVVNAASGYENDLVAGGPDRTSLWTRMFTQFPERAWPALRFLGSEVVLSPGASRLLWVPFLIALVAVPHLAFGAKRLQTTIAMLTAVIGYFFAFVGTFRDLEWQLGCAAERVMFHLWPALLLWTARLTADVFPRLRSPDHP